MIDISQTTKPKSDQLNADDLTLGPMTIRVNDVIIHNSKERPVEVRFDGDNGRPWYPGLSMRRVLGEVWGKDGKSYVGRYLTVYRDRAVVYGGQAVGGIRISHMSDIEHPVSVVITESRTKRKAFTVNPLAVDAEKEKLLSDGQKAAENGVETYTKWLASLSAAQKPKIQHMHKNWTAVAQKVTK